jgi:hypothetical protein
VGRRCSSTTRAILSPFIDEQTGEVSEAQLFVGVLGASNFTYVELTATQSLPDWIGSHVRMYAQPGRAGTQQALQRKPAE